MYICIYIYIHIHTCIDLQQDSWMMLGWPNTPRWVFCGQLPRTRCRVGDFKMLSGSDFKVRKFRWNEAQHCFPACFMKHHFYLHINPHISKDHTSNLHVIHSKAVEIMMYVDI